MATRKQINWTVPGFGLPLRWPEVQHVNWRPIFWPDENTLLLSALDASEGPKDCYTVRERTMIALINELTDTSDWEQRIFDTQFTFAWKSAKVIAGGDVTRSMADWCVEEVKYYVGDFLQSNIIPAIDGGVVKSDTHIPDDLRYDFQRLIARISRRSRKETESYDERSHVIDPFLFAFSWEKTRTLHYEALTLSDCIRRSGEGKLTRQPSEEECLEKERPRYPNPQAWSRRFQFLPFDVKFDNKGVGGSRITSYINNVHPHSHQSFYRTLERFIDAVVPVWNRTLISTKAPDYENVRLHVAMMTRDPLIQKDVDEFRPPEQRATKTWIDSQGRWQDFIFVDLKKEFWNVGLQMVLDVQDINLRPHQKTNYEGEEWHVQGQRNERLCATAIYVYSALNTTPARLSFRKRVHVEEAVIAKDYIQEPPWATDIYGARHGDPAIQHIGDINLREGRLITYPNIFQTRLMPFELMDKSKPGHVKLLTLHLVDPQRRMMSTSMVPPQRRDWWAEEVRRTSARFWRLPTEIWERIVGSVEEYPIGREEGAAIRREFAAERAEYQRKHTEAMMGHGEWDLEWEDDE